MAFLCSGRTVCHDHTDVKEWRCSGGTVCHDHTDVKEWRCSGRRGSFFVPDKC